MSQKKEVLLHICCAVCAIGAIMKLREEKYSVTGFYFNPNIHPEEEYVRRFRALKIVCKELNFPIIEGKYEKKRWFSKTEGLTEEPEGGKRCNICYNMRLRRTYEYFNQGNYDYFTTTLTISPHKNAERVNNIGGEIGGESYLKKNFKKKNGFKKAIEKAKNLSIYRQNYCGCEFSKR